ncbi:MAG: VTT domain-containing protein [Clostridia bacterium]|nr:VTT domain-containing protein [Clostridia bacterium]
MDKNKKDKILNIIKIAVAAAIFITAAVNYETLSNIDIRLLVASASSLAVALLLILGVYMVKAVLLVLPASVIYISVGVALDWKTAVIVNMLGIAIEVVITYFLGKFLGKDAVEKKLKGTKGGDKLLSMKDKNKNLATFIIRFVPAFPIDFSSLFMGAFDFKFLPYFLCSVAGIAPRVIAFTILGDKIYDLIPMKYIVLVAIAAIPVAGIAVAVKKIFAKKKG